MTLLQRPLFYVGGHYVTVLGLIAFVDPRRFRSDLNYLIYKHLTTAGIEIPNPQRDLHIRSGTLKVENVTKKTTRDDGRLKIHLITGRVMLSEAKHLGLWQ